MDHHTQVPTDIIDKANHFFKNKMIINAKALNEDQKLNVSFYRPRTNNGFIISGVILGNSKHSSRCTLKSDGTISSSCDCIEWNENEHCQHVAALFIKYYFINYFKEKYENLSDEEKSEKPHVVATGMGVHPKKYGTIISNPRQLEGANYNSTYASLQYILTNNKIQNFPIATKFEGKLKINLTPYKEIEQYKGLDLAADICACFFEHDLNGTITEKISIFEYLYIFNWETGGAYHLPDQLREFIKKLKISDYLLPMNDYIVLLRELIEKEVVEISYHDKLINLKDAKKVQTIVEITGSNRKNFLDISIKLIDENKQLLPPDIFKLMSMEKGYLENFKTKNEAAEFVNHLKNSVRDADGFFKRYIHSNKDKEDITLWGESINKFDKTYFIEKAFNELYEFENAHFVRLLTGIVEVFGTSFTRYSGFSIENKEVFFQMPKRTILDGIAEFFEIVHGDDISVYYNSKKVKTWSSNIKFERNQSSLDWFDLTLQINAKDLDVIKNADISEKYFEGKDGLVLLTPEQKDLLKFMQKYTKYEKVSAKNTENSEDGKTSFGLSLNRARIFELFELRRLGIDGALTPEELALCENLQNLTEIPQYPIPAKFTGIARPYQVTGYNWMRFLHENGFGACLADDMGLGKTIQTIMFLESIIDKVDKVMIICPVSILLNWQNEIQKFATFDVGVYYGDSRDFLDDKKVYLTSYGIMKKEAFDKFESLKFDVLIFDEVQHLKNIKSLGANAARKLNGRFRICLTGTPVENDLSEFYNIMDLSVPGVWGELGFIKSSSSKKNRLLAKKTVKPFILRRRKSEVLKELPDKIEQYVYLNFEENEKINYTNKLLKIRENLQQESMRKKYGEILKSLLELRQLCLWQNQMDMPTKISFLMENLEQLIEEGHKVLVFSQFTTYLDKIQNQITKRNWEYCRIDGSMSMKNRQKQVELFQEGKPQIFLISLKAGGVGLNLTAANYIFLMDPWWNPAVENQAIDRAHRIGQENKVTVYRPIIKDSVEEKVLVLQNAKRDLFKELLDDDVEYFSGKLSMEDFQMLLG